jgi:large repetitive protein
MKVTLVLAVLFLAALAVSPAFAADEENPMNMQHFVPSIFGGDFIAIDDADALGSLGFGFGLFYDYANSPFSYYFYSDDAADPRYDFIEEMHTGHVNLAFGPFKWLAVGGHLPVHYLRYRTFVNEHPVDTVGETQESDVVLGDVMAKMKIQALFQEKHWLGLALIPYASFPTDSGTEYDELFISEGRVTGGGTLALEHDFGPINVGLNGGYLYRGEPNELFESEIGDAATYGLGLSHTWDNGVGVGVEGWGRYYFVEEPDRFNPAPVEVTATLRYQFGDRGPRMVAGGGPGLSYGTGAPRYRVLAGIDYYYQKPVSGKLRVLTVDQDGKSVDADLTITDKDGSAKNATSDYDSSAKVGVYSVAASKDGYENASGEAAVADGETAELTLVLNFIPIPKTMLTINVIQAHTGDKIPATIKFDGQTIFLKSGILKKEWAAGAFTVDASAKGHESATQQFTVVKEQENLVTIKLKAKIELIGKVHFGSGSAVILKKSLPVLDDAVDKINLIGDFNKIVIAGHTDSQGDDGYNMKLSQRRVEAVKKYLVAKGIDGSKLETAALGETKPIGSNDTASGRAENRRVEFIVE